MRDYTEHADDNLWDAGDLWDLIRELLSICQISPWSPSPGQALGPHPHAAGERQSVASIGLQAQEKERARPLLLGCTTQGKTSAPALFKPLQTTFSSLKTKIFASEQ